MKVKCTSGNRELILRILQEHTGRRAEYDGLPSFSCTVGEYTLRRDGWIETALPNPDALSILGSLGLCDCPSSLRMATEPMTPGPSDLVFPMHSHTGSSLTNLMAILSARQHLLNRALDARGAFNIAPPLMNSLLAHPPTTIEGFLQALYGHAAEYAGIEFTLERIVFCGFRKGHPEEARIHCQLAGLIVRAALSLRWTKAFTRRVRNQKYAFRTWLNALGMIGPEYEEARSTMLSRLPGHSDRRPMPTRKEG